MEERKEKRIDKKVLDRMDKIGKQKGKKNV